MTWLEVFSRHTYDPKFWTDCLGKTVQIDLYQTVPRGSGSSLFAFEFASFCIIRRYKTMAEPLSLNFRVFTAKFNSLKL